MASMRQQLMFHRSPSRAHSLSIALNDHRTQSFQRALNQRHLGFGRLPLRMLLDLAGLRGLKLALTCISSPFGPQPLIPSKWIDSSHRIASVSKHHHSVLLKAQHPWIVHSGVMVQVLHQLPVPPQAPRTASPALLKAAVSWEVLYPSTPLPEPLPSALLPYENLHSARLRLRSPSTSASIPPMIQMLRLSSNSPPPAFPSTQNVALGSHSLVLHRAQQNPHHHRHSQPRPRRFHLHQKSLTAYLAPSPPNPFSHYAPSP